MCREVVSHPPHEQTTNVYTYQTIETVDAVATAMRRITGTRSPQIALVTIKLHFDHEGRIYAARRAQARHCTHYLLDNLRPLVRRTDEVFLLDHSFYFVLPGANLEGGRIVQDRLWDALLWRVHNISVEQIVRPGTMMIGYSAYPQPQEEISECISAASVTRMRFDAPGERAARRAAAHESRSGDEDLPGVARKLGVPYLSLLPRKLPEKVQQLVSPQLAQELHCYPLGRERDMLTVAMENPQDSKALARLREATGLHIFPVLTRPEELQTALAELSQLVRA
ncbi:MAG TPA: hypothetical protein VKV37_02340 [Ktedonobacteraceae bacterium]|nr:hypothetical protein [Ktedonobacteraceae bacterium]